MVTYITGREYKEYQKKGTIPPSVPKDAKIMLVGRPNGYTHVIEWEKNHGIEEDLGPHVGKSIEARRFESYDEVRSTTSP